jgi:hypothetical protein
MSLGLPGAALSCKIMRTVADESLNYACSFAGVRFCLRLMRR